MPTFTRPIVHRCDKNPDPELFVVRYNDYGIQIDGLPGITQGCPFCWTSYMTFRRERWERFCKRAFVAKPEELRAPVADVVRRLERPGFPKNGICSHFGPFVNVRGLGIHVMSQGPRLKVVMRQDHFRRPASLHQARARAVADALVTGIHETYNGGDGHDGIAVVLTRNAPEALLAAFENYRSQRDVFRRTPSEKAGWDAFDAWYDAPFEEAA